MMLRRALAAAALLLTVAGARLVSAQPASAPPMKERDGVWAQSYVGRPADPAVRFGTLPNGMRYAVTHSDSPKGVASFRLRIAAGSLEEKEDQRGLAHFLEHMAFKGSAHVPGDAMIKTLERMGLAFGADTNAGTGFDETVYKLDLPRSDAADLATALMLLREQASELTLSQAAMDPERGVVLSEERLRDTPSYQASKAQLAFLLMGQRAPTRWTIGDVQVLKTAPVSRIRDFYDTWYRPERATLVVAGDFDPAVMEAQIKARFSDWKAKTPAPPPIDLGAVERRGGDVKLFVQEGASQAVQVAWTSPYDDSADTFAHEREEFVRQLGLAVLNRRLADLAESSNPPFIGAGASRSDAVHSAEAAVIGVSTTAEGWRKGLVAALVEQRRLERFGVTAAELDREIVEARAALTTGLAGAATRRSVQIADAIVQSAGDDNVYTSPAQDLAEFERAVKGLTAAEVSTAMKTVFAGSGPLVFVSSPRPLDGAEPAVRAALQAAESAALTPPAAQASMTWPYAHLGPTASVVERREVKDLGVTYARLSNGVRVTVKTTAFRKDQVLLSVRFGHGRLSLPLDRPSPTWALGSLVTQGGTRELTHEQIERIASGRVAGIAFGMGDDAFTLNGATRPADLAFEMQLMAATLDRPGFRPEVYARTAAAAAQVIDRLESTPSGVLSRDFGPLSHSGDLRWRAVPDKAELATTTVAQVRALVEPAMTGDPLTVTVVGDVGVDEALKLAAQTFGALPRRHGATKPSAATLGVRFPAPALVERVHHGRADQAVALLAWRTDDLFSDIQKARALGLAADILQLRVTDRLRVAEGATYSPAVQSANSEVFPGYGFVMAQVETPPAKIPGFFTETAAIAADLAAKGPTPDEMDRAKRPRVEQRIKTQQTNEYWLGALNGSDADPRLLDAARQLVPGNERVTAADVEAVAAEYFRPDRAWRLMVRAPEPAPAARGLTPIAPTVPLRPPTVLPGPPRPAPPPTGAPPATPSASPAPPVASAPVAASPTH